MHKWFCLDYRSQQVSFKVFRLKIAFPLSKFNRGSGITTLAIIVSHKMIFRLFSYHALNWAGGGGRGAVVVVKWNIQLLEALQAKMNITTFTYYLFFGAISPFLKVFIVLKELKYICYITIIKSFFFQIEFAEWLSRTAQYRVLSNYLLK